ncbi:hypothetical protein NVIRPANT_00818 [Pantoea sp. Nvir]|nr:hypothetical protein NVIRPANT_00818 [Pantoea sp. Nvir]
MPTYIIKPEALHKLKQAITEVLIHEIHFNA